MKSPLPCGTQFLRKWFPQGNPHKLLFGRRGSYLSRTASQMGDTAARADTGAFTGPSIRWLMKLREYFGPDLFNLSG